MKTFPVKRTFKKASDFLQIRKIMSFFPSLVVPNYETSIQCYTPPPHHVLLLAHRTCSCMGSQGDDLSTIFMDFHVTFHWTFHFTIYIVNLGVFAICPISLVVWLISMSLFIGDFTILHRILQKPVNYGKKWSCPISLVISFFLVIEKLCMSCFIGNLTNFIIFMSCFIGYFTV